MGMNGQQSGKAAPEWGEGFANHASDFRITVQSAQKTKIQQQTASSKHGLRTGAGIAPQRTRDWPTTRCAPALTTRETQTSPSEATSPVGAAAVHTPENTHCPRGPCAQRREWTMGRLLRKPGWGSSKIKYHRVTQQLNFWVHAPKSGKLGPRYCARPRPSSISHKGSNTEAAQGSPRGLRERGNQGGGRTEGS